MNNISAESKVIATFTFVVAMLFGGWTAIVGLVATVFNSGIAPDMPHEVLTVVAYGTIAGMTVGALLVARAADEVTETLWAKHLAQATIILSVLVLAAAVIALIAGLAHGSNVLMPYMR